MLRLLSVVGGDKGCCMLLLFCRDGWCLVVFAGVVNCCSVVLSIVAVRGSLLMLFVVAVGAVRVV